MKGALNIPSPDLRARYREIDKKLLVMVICGTRHRSSLSTSILRQKGFATVMNSRLGI